MSGPSHDAAIPRQPRLSCRDVRILRGGGALEFPFNAPRQRSFAFARNALFAALRAIRVQPDQEVLVPAFHCVTVVDPVLRSGARCRFYNVDRQLRADMVSLEAAISERTRALLVIHFFGFPQALDEIARLCARHEIVLIEDCTHALYSSDAGHPLGTRGGLALFSFRKTLPVLGGALLVANGDAVGLPTVNRPPQWSYELRSVKYATDRILGRGTCREPLADPVVDHDNGRREPRRAAGGVGGSPDGWLYGYDFNPDLNERRGAAVSAWLARHFDSVAIRQRRRHNYDRMLKRLSDARGVRIPLSQLPEGASPWSFCIDTLGKSGLDRALRAQGVPAFTFGEVLHEALAVGAFPDAEYLSANLIQLPIHQDVSSEQIEQIATAVRKVLKA
jgi:perosamine synthetase